MFCHNKPLFRARSKGLGRLAHSVYSPVCLSESCGGSKFYDVTRALRYCTCAVHEAILLTRVASRNFKKLKSFFELFVARVYLEIPVIIF